MFGEKPRALGMGVGSVVCVEESVVFRVKKGETWTRLGGGGENRLVDS